MNEFYQEQILIREYNNLAEFLTKLKKEYQDNNWPTAYMPGIDARVNFYKRRIQEIENE